MTSASFVALPAGPLKIAPAHDHNNAARGYKHFQVLPLAASMGAEVCGLSLNQPLGQEAVAELKDALFRHGMLYFKQQELSIEDQERFTLYFGEFGEDAYTNGIEGHPNVTRVIKEPESKPKIIFGEGWHTDSPFLAQPPAISILYSIETPPYGGDTMFSSLRLALRYLSPTMRELVSRLKVRMSAARVMALLFEGDGDGKAGDQTVSVDQAAMIRGACHPLVRTHPETGEEALWVDHTYSLGIEGMTEAESRMLLGFLREHAVEESLTCRLRWEPNMLAMWDNRLVIHRAFNDYQGSRREMRRSTVQGEVPMSRL